MTAGLIGHTGFVGGNLAQQRSFDRFYSSANIHEIGGENFDILVCAGAPATMWAANQNPDADSSNLQTLITAIRSAKVDTLVMISTIAVFDDVSAGYNERTAHFEVKNAYGRNRRALERAAAECARRCIVLRLPALFGPGLKKNFLFDLINPVPSFLKNEKYQSLLAGFTDAERDCARALFRHYPDLGMWAFDRQAARQNSASEMLRLAFVRLGFTSRLFTNSESKFQFYNVERLSSDIDTCLNHSISELNVCSAPIKAADVHSLLIGEHYLNDGPPLVIENVHTVFAETFGNTAPYLIDTESVVRDLRCFYEQASRS